MPPWACISFSSQLKAYPPTPTSAASSPLSPTTMEIKPDICSGSSTELCSLSTTESNPYGFLMALPPKRKTENSSDVAKSNKKQHKRKRKPKMWAIWPRPWNNNKEQPTSQSKKGRMWRKCFVWWVYPSSKLQDRPRPKPATWTEWAKWMQFAQKIQIVWCLEQPPWSEI